MTGKPTANAVALELLNQPPPRSTTDPDRMTFAEAEQLVKEWRENKWAWIAWLLLTGVFTAFYVLYLRGLYLALAVGVVLTVITSAMYFSPWFKTSDRIFTLLAFMVGTFIADFICGFLSVVFG